MSSGKHVPIRPLTDDERSLVEGHYQHARSLAHRVWRTSRLPAWHLEEMMSEATLEMCRCVLRYTNYQDKSIAFSKMFVFSVVRRLRSYAAGASRVKPLEAGESLPVPVADDSLTDTLLRAMTSLTSRQRDVLEHRYGLAGQPPKTGHATKDALGLPYSTTYQAEKNAIRNLRHWLRENGCDS